MATTAVHERAAASTSPSRYLMIATYVIGGFGLVMATAALGSGDEASAARWLSSLAVGASSVLSFVRHSVFHRSDAARMHWDYGRRNDFQIEVGFANLAWGVLGITAWLLDWSLSAQGAIALVFGLYMLFAALLHVSELRSSGESGGRRYLSSAASVAFAGFLLYCGGSLVTA